MSHLDDKLFACHTTSGYSEVEWQEILEHVLHNLATCLGHPLNVQAMDYFPHGFAGDIRSQDTYAGVFQLSWFGRIGVTVVGHKEATVLEATLFLQGAGKRLIAIDGNDYLWLFYEQLSPGEFGWKMKWLPDEYGEYEQWGPVAQ